MYKPYQASLMAILEEMRRASGQYRPLFHQRLSDPMLVGPDVISEAAFLEFKKANSQPPDGEWESWERTPDGSYWGRYHGNQAGLDEFERLAESAYLILQEFDTELPEGHGVHGWLNVIHDMARDFPTPLLRTRFGVWGVEPQPEGDKFDELVTSWRKSNETNVEYRPHPIFNLLVHNVFTSSISAIELILDPEKALLVGDVNLEDSLVTPQLPGEYEPPEPEQEDSSDPPIGEGNDDQKVPNQIESQFPVETDAKPIVQVKFNGTTWTFKYEFLGHKEEEPFTCDLKGFHLYRAILERDVAIQERNELYLGREKVLRSLAFWKAAELRHPVVKYTNTGTADGDAEDKKAALDADDEGDLVSLEDGSEDDVIERESFANIKRQLKFLNDELNESPTPARRKELVQNIEMIEKYRDKDLNYKGKSRTLVTTDEEKARKKIRNRLDTARNMLSARMPRFADYLKLTVDFDDGEWSYDSRRFLKFVKKANNPQS